MSSPQEKIVERHLGIIKSELQSKNGHLSQLLVQIASLNDANYQKEDMQIMIQSIELEKNNISSEFLAKKQQQAQHIQVIETIIHNYKKDINQQQQKMCETLRAIENWSVDILQKFTRKKEKKPQNQNKSSSGLQKNNQQYQSQEEVKEQNMQMSEEDAFSLETNKSESNEEAYIVNLPMIQGPVIYEKVQSKIQSERESESAFNQDMRRRGANGEIISDIKKLESWKENLTRK